MTMVFDGTLGLTNPGNLTVAGGNLVTPSSMTLQTNGTNAAVIDTNQNVGFGQSPNAWYSGNKALQVYPVTSLFSDVSTAGGSYLTNNLYYTGSPGYNAMTTGAGSYYRLYQGAHTWFTTSSNTALSPVTTTQLMNLDTTGRLSVPNQVSFDAYVSTGLGSGFSSSVVLVYDVVKHNIGSAYNNSTGIFTAPVAGRYLITATASPGNWTGSMVWIAMTPQVNGSYYVAVPAVLGSGYNYNGNQYIMLTWSGIMNLSAGDSVKMVITYNTFNGNLNFGTFSGQLLG